MMTGSVVFCQPSGVVSAQFLKRMVQIRTATDCSKHLGVLPEYTQNFFLVCSGIRDVIRK